MKVCFQHVSTHNILVTVHVSTHNILVTVWCLTFFRAVKCGGMTKESGELSYIYLDLYVSREIKLVTHVWTHDSMGSNPIVMPTP